MMKYLLQVYLRQSWWQTQSATARAAFIQACHASNETLRVRGYLWAGHCADNKEAITLHGQQGAVCISDGLFREGVTAQEYRIERFVICARDLNDVIRVASQMPQVHRGVIEVIPMLDFNPTA